MERERRGERGGRGEREMEIGPIYRQASRQSDKQKDIHVFRQVGKQAGKQASRQIIR